MWNEYTITLYIYILGYKDGYLYSNLYDYLYIATEFQETQNHSLEIRAFLGVSMDIIVQSQPLILVVLYISYSM